LKKIYFLFKIELIKIIAEKRISFMSENSNSNIIENYEFNLKTEDSDYNDLMKKLKEIKTTIALLEKIIFK